MKKRINRSEKETKSPTKVKKKVIKNQNFYVLQMEGKPINRWSCSKSRCTCQFSKWNKLKFWFKKEKNVETHPVWIPGTKNSVPRPRDRCRFVRRVARRRGETRIILLVVRIAATTGPLGETRRDETISERERISRRPGALESAH